MVTVSSQVRRRTPWRFRLRVLRAVAAPAIIRRLRPQGRERRGGLDGAVAIRSAVRHRAGLYIITKFLDARGRDAYQKIIFTKATTETEIGGSESSGAP